MSWQGGYLVLEAPNVGLTVSTSSRFYTSVRCQPSASNAPAGTFIIVVESPQFHEGYEYLYDARDGQLTQRSAAGNGFVEKCLLMTLSFIKQHQGEAFLRQVEAMGRSGKCLCMRLCAHNDFYSQTARLEQHGQPLRSSSLRALPAFVPCPRSPSDPDGAVAVAKTGLGSSATLVTSIVGALLQFFGVTRLGFRIALEDRRLIHNLAQLAHSHAQGKIGSGFDVSAAVYGSQLYRRFDQQPFLSLLQGKAEGEGKGEGDREALHRAVTDSGLWTQQVLPFQLPPMVDLVLGDVCGGSSSSSMARAVLDFRSAHPQRAAVLWDQLAETNLLAYSALSSLSALHERSGERYEQMMRWAANGSAEQWAAPPQGCGKVEQEVCACLLDIRRHFEQARRLLKELGQGAGVEIEPDQQTDLLAASLAVPGVLAGAVPGAGGNDAVFVLTIGEQARDRVEALWADWATSHAGRPRVCALLLSAASAGHAGIQAELDMPWI